MKKLVSLIIICTFSFVFSQEESIKKTKIGKYEYEIYLGDFYNYEIDEYGISYHIRLNGKEQLIGGFLTYRTFIRSRNSPIIDEKLPPNPLLRFNDREVTGEGKIEIKKDAKEIVNTFVKYTKAYDSDPDSTKRVYKQKKDGFFELTKVLEYRDGEEKIVFEK